MRGSPIRHNPTLESQPLFEISLQSVRILARPVAINLVVAAHERPYVGGAPPAVWDLAVLNDLSVLTADSFGRVQVWEGRFGTLQQSFAQHTAPVKALVASSDGLSARAAGVDNLIIHLQQHN